MTKTEALELSYRPIHAFDYFREDRRTPIHEIREIHEIHGVPVNRSESYPAHPNSFNDLRMAEGLLNGSRAVVIARQKGTLEQKSKSFIRCHKMSYRVARVVGSDDIVALSISGRITKQDVETLCNVVDEEGSAVAIDLQNVVLVDREVVKFLAQRELTGTVLRNCPLYIREWVTREQAETMETTGDTEDA
jgi:hypothetical protein